jgi:hypothetical protein
MAAVKNTKDKTLGFGFLPEESLHHFFVTIAAGDCQHESPPQDLYVSNLGG